MGGSETATRFVVPRASKFVSPDGVLVFVGGSMALCSCTHTSVVQPRCVYTHLGGLPKLDTLRFWPGYMFTLASCKYIFLGRWYVYTHLGSHHIYTHLVSRQRYVYTHFGSSDVGGGVVFRSSSQGPETPSELPPGPLRIMIFGFDIFVHTSGFRPQTSQQT